MPNFVCSRNLENSLDNLESHTQKLVRTMKTFSYPQRQDPSCLVAVFQFERLWGGRGGGADENKKIFIYFATDHPTLSLGYFWGNDLHIQMKESISPKASVENSSA